MVIKFDMRVGMEGGKEREMYKGEQRVKGECSTTKKGRYVKVRGRKGKQGETGWGMGGDQ